MAGARGEKLKGGARAARFARAGAAPAQVEKILTQRLKKSKRFFNVFLNVF